MNIFSIGRIWFFWINLTFLLVFAIRRFLRRQANPPPEFVFVGVGLLLGWIAAWIRFDTWMPWSLGISELVGRRLISEGMVLMLVLGVAGKLVPMFFGFSKANPLVALGNAASVRGKIVVQRKYCDCVAYFVSDGTCAGLDSSSAVSASWGCIVCFFL
jgi:hypothetical protein